MGRQGQDHITVLIDGAPTALADAAIALTDAGVARGDGAFETVGVWDGHPFRLADHLDRLAASLSAIALDPPPRHTLEEEAAQLLEDNNDDGALRIYLTASGTRILTLSPLPDRGVVRSLSPQPAPWVQPPASYRPAGAKTMSYGPNMTAHRMALLDGADDALLISHPDGWVLEGPTFGVVFVIDRVIHVPSVELGIVDSISRRTLVEIAQDRGMGSVVGRWKLETLAEADEVIISSSLRNATAVSRVAEWTYDAHPVADALNEELRRRRREVLG